MPLLVSQKLQNQISFLCSEVNDDEWSGTLFYSVEGDLGEDNFKIKAEELFLQDIGNATYTEYDPGNPDFIRFLMDNPDYMNMKQGHIHSHNKMSVFFSGTDSDELVDNSAFHNFYVSLIVNNKNEMCAKIAFRATETREVKSVVSFKGADGSAKSKEVNSTNEEVGVYAYTCDVETPPLGELFESRFLQIRTSSEERAKKLAKEAKEIAKSIGSERTLEEKAYGGFDGKGRYSQVGLYNDIKPGGGKKKGKDLLKGDKGDWSGSIDIDYVVEESRTIKNYSQPRKTADPNVYNFIVNLLTRDFLSNEKLSLVLSKLNKDLYSKEYSHREGADNEYFDSLNAIAISHYINCFPEDVHTENYNKVLGLCVAMLEPYESVYPELVENLGIALNFCMDE